MARAGSRGLSLRQVEGDDVEKSLELLDKVLSEFEDPDSLPPVEPDSPSQGHQSEDDGYMSMNGRRAKFSPGFQPTDEIIPIPPAPPPPPPQSSSLLETSSSYPSNVTEIIQNEKSLPPPPEEAERVISNLLPRVSPSNTLNTNSNNNIHKICLDRKLLNGDNPTDVILVQRTLPKARPSTVIPSRYASLPCSSPPRLQLENLHSTTSGGDGYGGGSSVVGGSGVGGCRNSIDGISGLNGRDGEHYGKMTGNGTGGNRSRQILGIGISAVHDAVLRGVTCIPEPIFNEHPVTIYPGRASPTRKMPPRTLPGSIERHREVCRVNSSDTSQGDGSNENLVSSLSTYILDPISYEPQSTIPTNLQKSQTSIALHPSYKSNYNINNNNNNNNNTHDNSLHNNNNYNNNLINNINNNSIPPFHLHNNNNNNFNNNDNNINNNSNNNNNRNINSNINNNSNNNNNNTNNNDHINNISDSEDFSDDSLEGSSLPPPPPPPVVPPPPSLSAPVTPSKRCSIAWEINLDDSNFDDNFQRQQSRSGRVIASRRRGRNLYGSQSSLASTPPGINSNVSNKYMGSTEWPEPPICSTEDEATSLHSDSADDIIPYPSDLKGHGTYVIRKGRKERQRLSELESMSSSVNSRLSNEENFILTNLIFTPSLRVPNSRHSIDLGSPSTPPLPPPPPPLPPSSSVTQQNSSSSIVQNSLNSPRSRLSLDLSSPTSELPAANLATSNTILSPRYSEFKTYSSTFDGLHALENGTNNIVGMSGKNGGNFIDSNLDSSANNMNSILPLPLMRVASLPTIPPPVHTTGEVLSTPRRELAPPIEEDEEQDSESQRGAPLRQIENNISALLRGDIAVVRVGDIPPPRRPLGFRPGVHKSESAKEMLLSQTIFGPLPPSPPSTSPEESDGFPPLPPSPRHHDCTEDFTDGIRNIRLSSHGRIKNEHRYHDNIIEHPPAVPPHKGSSLNTLKTRSMDAGFSKSYRNNGAYSTNSPHAPGTLPQDLQGSNTRRRLTSGAFPKRSAQSPREERRLQTSCSLPETPIFARGCDIPRTPHRRAPDLPGMSNSCSGSSGGGIVVSSVCNSGSRTAPRPNSGLNSSIIGIGNTVGGRQRSISHALASGEMLRLAGGPARGWYPKQRHPRPASTENLDRINTHGASIRAWDAGTGSRKPLTLPPNLTPKFFNKSPREALRRVTSLLIRNKAQNGKDNKDQKRDKDKDMFGSTINRSPGSTADEIHSTSSGTTTSTGHKKKGFFKSFWKKSKHYSLEQ